MSGPDKSVSSGDKQTASLTRRSWIIATLVILAGLPFRIALLDRFYLDSDEAMHFQAALEPTIGGALQASQSYTHPPLIFLAYHFWLPFADNELMLRLPSLILGVAAQYLAFVWLKQMTGPRGALVGLVLLTFSMPIIHLSAQMRGYPLLWCFHFSALIFFQRFLERRRASDLTLYTICLMLALSTHYSTAWLILTLGICGLINVIGRRPGTRFSVMWVGAQLSLLAACLTAYRFHISSFVGSSTQADLWDFWLHDNRFAHSPGGQFSLLVMMGIRFLSYVSGQLWPLLAIAIPIGVSSLIQIVHEQTHSRSAVPVVASMAVLPFLLSGILLLARVYPLGPTRHSLWLMPFVLVTVAAVSNRLFVRFPRMAGTGMICLGLCWIWLYPGRAVFATSTNQTPELMRRTIVELEKHVPQGATIVTDEATRNVLAYYLSPRIVCSPVSLGGGYTQYRMAGYRIVTVPEFYLFACCMRNDVDTFRQALGHSNGDAYWIVYLGFAHPDNRPEFILPRFPAGRTIAAYSIGDNQIIHLHSLSPTDVLPAGSESRRASNRRSSDFRLPLSARETAL